MKLTLEEFRAETGKDLYKGLDSPSVKVGDDTFRVIASTDTPDRVGHIVKARGGNLENYRRNPVVMWNHAGYDNPSNIIGKALKIFQFDDRVEAIIQYIPLRGNPLPEQLLELERKGLLPGNSIGLRPTGKITREGNLTTIGEWELIDISKVSVGMNGRATNTIIQPS